jgi:hypothetical protein
LPKADKDSRDALPWPERDLAHDPVALSFFRQICECCDRDELGLLFARMLSLRRRDSWDEATDGLSLERLATIATQAKEFENTLHVLRKTVLIKHLADDGKIKIGDLRHPRTNLKPLTGVTHLRELAGESGIGPASKPDFQEDIEHLTRLVKEGCGRFHYDKLEKILAAFGFPIRLKQFRSDQRKRTAAVGKKHRP